MLKQMIELFKRSIGEDESSPVGAPQEAAADAFYDLCFVKRILAVKH